MLAAVMGAIIASAASVGQASAHGGSFGGGFSSGHFAGAAPPGGVFKKKDSFGGSVQPSSPLTKKK